MSIGRESQELRAIMLGALAHDLKNPLTILRMNAERLSMKISRDEATISREEVQEVLLKIVDSSKRMSVVVSELMETAQNEAIQASLKLDQTLNNLGDIVQDAIGDIASPHHRIEVEERETIMTLCDRGRLTRVIQNLIVNASKYSPRGTTITITIGCIDGQAHIRVQDQGIGIAEEDVSEVFTPYRRGRNISTRLPGAGIGLATSKEIVEQHGGSISISSREGFGTSVVIILPITLPEVMPEPIRSGVEDVA